MALSIFILAIFAADSTPRHGDTILFVGDSITQAGHYVADVEAYILACRPNNYFRVVNVGKSSETVSGTSEPDHHPPRPCIHDRFARDVAAFKPNIVVACYGMNDGNYFPWDEERFEKYKAGMTRFIDRVFKETPARSVVLLTPPPFEASNAPPPPADGMNFGYKHPARNYDGVLRTYSDWLVKQQSDRVAVVDLHREMHLERRERSSSRRAEYSFSPDGVHPSTAGHWIMAQTLLLEWKIRPSWRELSLDVLRPQESLSWKAGRWTWRTPAVTPPVRWIQPRSNPRSPDPRLKELFDQSINISGLPGVPETRIAVGTSLMDESAAQRRIKVAVYPSDLSAQQSRGIDRQPDPIRDRRRRITEAWLAAQKDKPFTDLKLSVSAVEKAEMDAADLNGAIDERLKSISYQVFIAD